MQFTPEMNWGPGDFVFAAIIIAIFGGMVELAAGASPRLDYRTGFALAVLGALAVIWVNLAVGIVGSEDNPANNWFFAALGLAIVGATVARLRAGGMSVAMFGTAAALVVALFVAQAGATDEPWVPPGREIIGTGLFAAIFVASGLLFRRAARALAG
ncbi:hypothetical protein GCM10023325_05270 [Sphingomonas lutea]